MLVQKSPVYQVERGVFRWDDGAQASAAAWMGADPGWSHGVMFTYNRMRDRPGTVVSISFLYAKPTFTAAGEPIFSRLICVNKLKGEAASVLANAQHCLCPFSSSSSTQRKMLQVVKTLSQ